MTHFSAVRGSVSPTLADVLSTNGSPRNLTGATIVLRLRHRSTDEIVDFAMTIGDPTLGEVSRVWVAGDLDIREGVWLGQYRVTISGALEIWPTSTTADPCDHLLGWDGLWFEICAAN